MGEQPVCEVEEVFGGRFDVFCCPDDFVDCSYCTSATIKRGKESIQKLTLKVIQESIDSSSKVRNANMVDPSLASHPRLVSFRPLCHVFTAHLEELYRAVKTFQRGAIGAYFGRLATSSYILLLVSSKEIAHCRTLSSSVQCLLSVLSCLVPSQSLCSGIFTSQILSCLSLFQRSSSCTFCLIGRWYWLGWSQGLHWHHV